jgi:hypothetical protein
LIASDLSLNAETNKVKDNKVTEIQFFCIVIEFCFLVGQYLTPQKVE